jgi:hypothetical protein
VTGYMHPGWDGVKPWQDILPDTPPPDPRGHAASHRVIPRPAPAEPGPARPGWVPRPPREVPAWEAAELAGSDCVGPGAAWELDDD